MKIFRSIYIIVGLAIVACQPSKTDRFTIQGTISQAQGKTLYLDNLGTSFITVRDSVKLDADGNFSFSAPAAEGFDFYRLRLDRQFIILAADSVETITVNASGPEMQTGYQVEGSEESLQLKELMMLLYDLGKDVRKLAAMPATSENNGRLQEMIDVAKTEIKNRFILSQPSSPVAYYAVFSSIDGVNLFQPQTDRQDAKCLAAVATAMEIKYPEALRTRHIKNVALKGMKATSTPKPVSQETLQALSNIVVESGLIEISLPDAQGVERKLSELKGKVVLLDFTAYKTSYSASYNLMLRELYAKYASQGFEIYQVSLDADSHFWKLSAENIPWVAVYDEQSLESVSVRNYRVESLPTAFLINREGEIVSRLNSSTQIDSEIEALL